jgi:signal transduction histidine kinase
MVETLKKINVLFIEDNPDDVELELYELSKGGFDISHTVARNREQFLASLENLEADIVIADYSLPDLTGIEAIHILKDREIKVPVILITGAGNEQVAVDSLREGAIDYILKKNIDGFSARVSRALDIWADRQAIEIVELEKKKLQQQLFQSQKMESVGRLAGGIAHDFNNLLTGIMGYASLSLRTIPDGTPANKNIQTIIEVSKRASNLVKQLLLFSRKIPLEFKMLDINHLVKENMNFIRRMVEEAVEIKLDLADDLPEIKSDQGQLTQVIMNFAINARDAMDGKGVLTIKTEKTSSDLADFATNPQSGAKEYILLSVTDTGCGIAKDDQQNIFDPFFTTKEVGKGTGLGLSIVYSIIVGHGGWVDVISEKGKGATFRVFLPVIEKKELEAEADRPATDTLDSFTSSISGNETILIVEDEEVLRSFTIEMLKDLGYNVLAAKNGVEALVTYTENSDIINLVVSDMVMPEKSGLELFNELRAIKPDIKFILVTGYCLEEAEGQVLRNMSAILMKPYTTEKIAALIRKVLDE